MLPGPDNVVSAFLLLVVGVVQLLVVGGLIVLAYAGLSWTIGRGVDAARRRRPTPPPATSKSDS